MLLGDIINMLSWWQWGLIGLVPPAIVALYFLKLRRQPLDLTEIVGLAMDGIVASAERKAILVDRFEPSCDLIANGDPGRLQWDLARYQAVTPEKVRDFARQLLTDKRVVLHAVPEKTAPAATQARPTPVKEGT